MKEPAPALACQPYWLQSIQLSNYRCFSHLKVDFDQQLTVLVARNGAGKTTLLDAIAIAFGTFVGSFYNGKSSQINKRDVRLTVTNHDLHEMEPQYPAGIYAQAYWQGEFIEWARHLNTPKSATTRIEAKQLTVIAERMQQAITKKQPVDLPLLAYYGTGRLWLQKKLSEKKVYEGEFYSRTVGYQDCLDSASHYKYFENWLRYVTRAEFDLSNQRRERLGHHDYETDTPYSPLIFVIRQAVDECLKITGWQNIRYSFSHLAIVMEHVDEGVLELGQLSDGVRNMIALVADIAYRIARLNAHLGREAAKATSGLVLIDEIDLHLHPEWQQTVLQNLTTAFPKIQFVVTTHSPQVISCLRREQIRLLDVDLQGQLIAAIPSANPYGRSNADVMQTVMRVSPEPHLPETQQLRQYLSLMEQGDWRSDAARILRQNLQSQLGADHPALIRADMIARRRQVMEP